MTRASADRQALQSRLEPWGQTHVLQYWDDLTEDRQARLAHQILGIDLALVDRLFRTGGAAQDVESLARRAAPPPAVRLQAGKNPFTLPQAQQRGRQALGEGKVGVLLVAGGQGTRLGFDQPKGMFPIGPVSRATLFQVLVEKLRAMARRHGCQIPLYVMTSPATHVETVEFFQAHHRLGLANDQLHFFCQGTMPAVDAASGRLLLADVDQLCLSPDGHGGMLAALDAAGLFDDFAQRGLEQLFYIQVDNPLVRVCDEAFLGYHLLAGSEMSTQVVAKREPRERVGNVVQIDGRVQILEYSDLNPLGDDIVLAQTADGQPVFWAGSIAVHVFDVAFCQRVRQQPESLPFHLARKAIAHLDADGQRVEPTQPNAIQFERFIFDLLPLAEGSIVVEVDRATTFAPLKNGPGAGSDSPETVQAQMVALHRGWLEEAGLRVAPNVAVEISPLFALDAQELAGKVQAGSTVDSPTYFS